VKYNFKSFDKEFPDDAACLEYIFKSRFPDQLCVCGKSHCFHRRTKRRAYACAFCGHQIYPTAGTIFHKSETSLKSWFFAIFLMAQSRNGVAAKELERQLGVTYKCAWRMAHQIRKLLASGLANKLMGVVEADEAYFGGIRPGKRGRGAAGKTPVVGLAERGGSVDAKVVDAVTTSNVFINIDRKVDRSASLYSDELAVYRYAPRFGFRHRKVNHGRGEYVRGDIHTNTIEGFWSQVKRSIGGTHHSVSRKYLQNYINEFSFRYNHRKDASLFASMVARVPSTLSEAA